MDYEQESKVQLFSTLLSAKKTDGESTNTQIIHEESIDNESALRARSLPPLSF